MKKIETIMPVTVGFKTVIRVPESWDVFTFNGFLYRRDDAGRVVIDRANYGRKSEDEKSSASERKSA